MSSKHRGMVPAAIVAVAAIAQASAAVAAMARPAALPAALFGGAAAGKPCSPEQDPWCNSGCGCLEFCLGKCAINATKGPVKAREYRMTMKGVLELGEKNTGNMKGDMSFVLGQRVHQFQCRKTPNSILCQNLAQFEGDTPNNTDLVVEVDYTSDGQWGPYLYCNPENVHDPRGAWSCLAAVNQSNPAVTKQCNNDFDIISDQVWNFLSAPKVIPGATTLQACCAAATKGNLKIWAFYASNSTCVSGSTATLNNADPLIGDNGGSAGYSKALAPKPCDCPRVHKTVGREDLSVVFAGSSLAKQYPLGGEWLSRPTKGMCTAGHHVGDGSGCTWEGTINKVIQARCMYKLVDAFVESRAPSCFGKCAVPLNKTGDCYLGCFANVTLTEEPAVLLEPWQQAFGGGCPLIPH